MDLSHIYFKYISCSCYA